MRFSTQFQSVSKIIFTKLQNACDKKGESVPYFYVVLISFGEDTHLMSFDKI